MLKYPLTASAFLALLVAGPLQAQQSTFSNIDAADTAVDDIAEAVEEDIADAQDVRDFGLGSSTLGWSGAIYATASAVSGNSDTADLGIGARATYFDGVNGHELTFYYDYGEADGDSTENSLLLGYDYNRFFTEDFYGYGQLRAKYDEFSTYEYDTFVGVGVGYRVVNTPDMIWSLQAGPGWRTAETQSGVEVEEVAASLGSKFYYDISEGVFLTNDTYVIASETDTTVTNEIGLNVSLSGPLTLRTTLQTDYNSDPEPGLENTDNTLGMSLVYTFN